MLEAAPQRLGPRGFILIAILLAGGAAFWLLDLGPDQLLPREGGWQILGNFLEAAWKPALDYEAEFVPADAPAFLWSVLEAMRRTLIFAAAALSLALPFGLILGFLSSSVWWAQEQASARRSSWATLRRALGPIVQAAVRVLIACLRSVHELLWAVIFLAAFGLNPASAVLALMIPAIGILAKVFSEMLDEAPRDAALALQAAGATPLRVFLFGILPRALPDLASYTFYRFECVLRSSAVLGFFGFPTLGYALHASYENLHYREVWTYLYALLALILLFELWSSRLRGRFVA